MRAFQYRTFHLHRSPEPCSVAPHRHRDTADTSALTRPRRLSIPGRLLRSSNPALVCFYLLRPPSQRLRDHYSQLSDREAETEGETKKERQRETERERSVSSVTDSLSDQTESYRLPVIFISGYLDMYVFINLSGAVCLSEVSVGSCWRSASCLHGNRIHEPQIAPPSRVSLRCGGAISNHITPLHISHPSTAPRRSC